MLEPDGDGGRRCQVEVVGGSGRGVSRLNSRNRVSTIRASAAACLRSRARKAVPLRPSTNASPADGSGAQTTSSGPVDPVSYTHLRAHETDSYLVCRLL